MTRRRKILVFVAAPLVLLLATFIYLSLDESPPDLGPLALKRLEIPDAENADTYFRMAGEAIYWPQHLQSAGSGEAGEGAEAAEDREYLVEDMALGVAWDAAAAADVLRRNKDVLALIDRGLACRKWQRPLPSLDSPVQLYYLHLARLMCLRAESLAHEGKPDEAIVEAVRTAEFGHKHHGGKGTVADFLVGTTSKQLGAMKVRGLLSKDGLAADRLRPLVDRLAAVTDEGPALADTFRGEYAWVAVSLADPQAALAYYGGKTAGPGANPLDNIGKAADSIAWRLGYFYKPNRTARQFVAFYVGRLEEAGKPFAQVNLPPAPPPTDWSSSTPLRFLVPNSYGRLMFSFTTPAVAISGVHKVKSRSQTETAATQALIALKGFKLKTGRLPQKLDELVPEFLSAVPRDDFDGKPIRYSAEKKIVYSVGTDLKDDGGFSKEEARKWWAENKPDEPLEEGKDPDPYELPDLCFPIDF
jgi:hypothetical protein